MVSIRKAKKAEKKLNSENNLKKQDMSLDEAYRLVDSIYNKPDAVIDWRELDKALSIISVSDANFAADMKKDFELREAYQIAGGYYQYGHNALQKTIDKRFKKAITLIEADDPEFAETLKNLHDIGTSFKMATSEQMTQNARVLNTLTADAELANEVVADPEIAEAFSHSPIETEDPEEARTAQDIVEATARMDVVPPLTESQSFAEANEEEKREMFADKLKKAIKWNLFKARVKALGNSISGIKTALNFKKKVKVPFSAAVDGLKRSTKRFASYISNVAKRGHSAAAAWLNKYRMRVATGAAAVTLIASAVGCSFQKNQSQSNSNKPTVEVRGALTSSTLVSGAVLTDTLSATTPKTMADSTIVAQADTTNTMKTASRVATSATTAADDVSTWTFNDSITVTSASVDTASVTRNVSAPTATDSVQIVTDSDTIPFGTPAAGYVAERGGFENRGVGSKRQYMNLRAKIQSTFAAELGENAYDLIVEHIDSHPEIFRSKGRIGEGWTADQILQSYYTMSAASAGYGEELKVLGRLLNPRGCDMNVTIDEMGQINDMLAHSNADNLRDGVLYNMPTRTVGITFSNCDKPVELSVERTNQTNIKPNRTNSIKHPEFYKLSIRPVRSEPIITGFNDVYGDTITNIVYEDSIVAPHATLHKGSELDVNAPGSSKIGDVSLGDVAGIDLTDNTKVLVEQTTDSTTITGFGETVVTTTYVNSDSSGSANVSVLEGSEMRPGAAGSNYRGETSLENVASVNTSDNTKVLASNKTTTKGKTPSRRELERQSLEQAYDETCILLGLHGSSQGK